MRRRQADLPARPRGAGFSLVELMLVVAIIGLAASVVSVSWQALLPNQRLNSDVRALSNVLLGARVDAISRSTEMRVFYDLDRERYWVEMPSPEAALERSGTNLETEELEDDQKLRLFETSLSEGVELVRATIDSVDYDAGVVYVRFDPLGASSEHSILLRQVGFQRDFTIEVLPLTGLIRFHDGVFERDEAEDEDFN